MRPLDLRAVKVLALFRAGNCGNPPEEGCGLSIDCPILDTAAVYACHTEPDCASTPLPSFCRDIHNSTYQLRRNRVVGNKEDCMFNGMWAMTDACYDRVVNDCNTMPIYIPKASDDPKVKHAQAEFEQGKRRPETRQMDRQQRRQRRN